jgi:phage regulator Rha-like protein
VDKNPVTRIEKMIYVIRGQKVMVDSDLAELYGVENKDLTRQVRRNISRFPEDFLLIPEINELGDLRRQFGAANPTSLWNYKRRVPPMLFTENGIAMLSSVLNSERAIQVNIAIIRVFTQMRSFLAIENANSEKINKLEKNTHKLFKIVFERMDNIESVIDSKLPSKKKKIGLSRE